MVHLALGNHDEAYELFQQGLQEREAKLFWLKQTGYFGAVDVDARLKELLEQVSSH
jgi:hypothetical protein